MELFTPVLCASGTEIVLQFRIDHREVPLPAAPAAAASALRLSPLLCVLFTLKGQREALAIKGHLHSKMGQAQPIYKFKFLLPLLVPSILPKNTF